jgi:DNA repair exonuclease SbcCD ATPase subunit
MATNRDLLKEAIADAKAVKSMAIANAKTALEEAFTPHLKEMFSAKIQEMDKDDSMEEGMYEEDDMKEGDELDEMYHEDDMKEGEDLDEVDLEELLAELEEEEKEELNEAEDEDEVEDDEEESEEEEGEPLDLEDMTDEDLKKMIEDVIADMVASGELEGGDVEDEVEDEEVEMSDEEEEVDLAELLKEIEEEMTEEEVNEEMIDEAGIVSPEVVDFLTGIPWVALPFLVFGGGAAAAAIPGYRKWKQENAEKAAKAEKMVPKISSAQKAELAKLSAEKKAEGDNTAEKDELMEAKAEIKSLKSDLNEAVKTTNSTNLLNAKLLYTNKIFKAKNLNESQKVKVLSSFDKANTVKEAKLVYETLSEGLKVKKSTIRENLGRASKATTIPTTKKPIMESNDVFARMQKLAGIIK